MQHEITSKGPLLDGCGRLVEPGYARSMLQDYNPGNIRTCPLRPLNRLVLKEWDYYGITGKDFFFSATVSNLGYAGMLFVYYIDFNDKTYIEKSIITPFGKGCDLPGTTATGDVMFKDDTASIIFIRGEKTRGLRVNWKRFSGTSPLAAEIVLHQRPEADSIVMTTPIGKKRFYYNQKINCMPAEGEVRFGRRTHVFGRREALGTLDWGRGVWEYSSFWNWASASAYLPGGRTFGLNLGKGFGDLSAATENCFFIDGVMTKLDTTEFHYDPSDYMRPWFFATTDKKLGLTFTPFFERTAISNLLIIASEVHQMFGTWKGHCTTDRGERIEIPGIIGWAEEHRARW
jgi:hypothetical protein